MNKNKTPFECGRTDKQSGRPRFPSCMTDDGRFKFANEMNDHEIAEYNRGYDEAEETGGKV